MYVFNLASKGPISVKLSADGEVYNLPIFQRKDWKVWGKELDDARLEKATENFDDMQRAQFLMLYPLEPITRAELYKQAQTIEGTGRVFTTCARAANVPEAEIKRIVEDGDCDEGYLESVVLMLIGIADPAEVAKRLGVTADEEGKGDGDDGENAEDPNDPLQLTRAG